MRLPSKAVRLAWIAQQLSSLPGHGIIYTLTIRDANQRQIGSRPCFTVDLYTGENRRLARTA